MFYFFPTTRNDTRRSRGRLHDLYTYELQSFYLTIVRVRRVRTGFFIRAGGRVPSARARFLSDLEIFFTDVERVCRRSLLHVVINVFISFSIFVIISPAQGTLWNTSGKIRKINTVFRTLIVYASYCLFLTGFVVHDFC